MARRCLPRIKKQINMRSVRYSSTPGPWALGPRDGGLNGTRTEHILDYKMSDKDVPLHPTLHTSWSGVSTRHGERLASSATSAQACSSRCLPPRGPVQAVLLWSPRSAPPGEQQTRGHRLVPPARRLRWLQNYEKSDATFQTRVYAP